MPLPQGVGTLVWTFFEVKGKNIEGQQTNKLIKFKSIQGYKIIKVYMPQEF